VNGFFPNNVLTGERMSPFYLLDYNAKKDLPPSGVEHGVGPHPHRGFETVTIAYHGRIAHHDSRGGGGVIGEGDVQWMTAGSGLLHKEYHEEEFNRTGGPFQMVQLWVNLPAKDKMTEPRYQAISNDAMGRAPLENGGYVEIIAGEYAGVKGPAATHTPVYLYNVKAKKATSVNLNFPAHYTTAILAIEGNATLNGRNALPTNHLALFAQDGEEIELTAETDGTFLVLSGEPLNEPIAQYGPFLMNTQREIAESDRRLSKWQVRAFSGLNKGPDTQRVRLAITFPMNSLMLLFSIQRTTTTRSFSGST
jgi:redox-sensitive bicupin YhaK (pirin superfamily)